MKDLRISLNLKLLKKKWSAEQPGRQILIENLFSILTEDLLVDMAACH